MRQSISSCFPQAVPWSCECQLPASLLAYMISVVDCLASPALKVPPMRPMQAATAPQSAGKTSRGRCGTSGYGAGRLLRSTIARIQHSTQASAGTPPLSTRRSAGGVGGVTGPGTALRPMRTTDDGRGARRAGGPGNGRAG